MAGPIIKPIAKMVASWVCSNEQETRLSGSPGAEVFGSTQASGLYPRTMSHRAASSPIFEPLTGAKSRQRVSWPLGSRARICLNCPSRSLLGKPLMKHSVVSSFFSPFQTRAWMCAAGRPR